MLKTVERKNHTVLFPAPVGPIILVGGMLGDLSYKMRLLTGQSDLAGKIGIWVMKAW